MVGAMQRVDAILQRSKCAIGTGPSRPSTGFPGQGRRCSCWGRGIYGTLCKEVADKRGHLPAQATSTLAWCERPAWARKCRSRHEGHLNFTWMAWRITIWWKRCYEGLRGARFVSPLSHIILRIFTGRCVLVVLWFGVCLGCFGCFLGYF